MCHERSSPYEKWSSSNKVHELSLSLVQKFLKLSKGKCKNSVEEKNNSEVYMELQLTKFILIGELPVWYLEETLKMSDPFQNCTWGFPINCHQIPKTLSSNSLYFFSYWGFISLTQTQENNTDVTHFELDTMHDLMAIFVLKTMNYKIILVPNQSIYILLYIKAKRFHKSGFMMHALDDKEEIYLYCS